jgi:hypothetical protein
MKSATCHCKLTLSNVPLRRRLSNRMAKNPKTDKHEEYVRYAEHCLAMAKLAPDQASRSIQREMAAEWLRLAEKE